MYRVHRLPLVLFFCSLLFIVFNLLLQRAEVSASSNTPISFALSFEAEEPVLKADTRPEGTFTVFESTRPVTGKTGAPALPLETKVVGIPLLSLPQLAVTLADPLPLPRLSHPLEPVPTYEPVLYPNSETMVGDYLEASYRIDERVYSHDDWYPAHPITIGEPMSLRGQAIIQVHFTPVQVNLATGEMRWYPAADVTLSWSTETLSQAQWLSLEKGTDPHFESILASTLSNYEQAQAWRMEAHHSQAPLSKGGNEEWIITLEGTGLFQIPFDMLTEAGVPLTEPNRLAIYYGSVDNLEEQALWIDNQTLYLLNSRPAERWSSKVIYRLKIKDDGEGLRMTTLDSTPTYTQTLTSVEYDLRFEEEHTYQSQETSTRAEEHWFWRRLLVHSALPTDTFTIAFDLPHLDVTSPYTAQIKSEVGPIHTSYTRCYDVTVEINDQFLAHKTWHNPQEGFEETLLVPTTALGLTGNSYQVEQHLCGISTSMMLNSFTVRYPRRLNVDQDFMTFSTQNVTNTNYEVTGFTTEDILAFDVSSLSTPQRLINGTQSGNGPYTFTFGSATAAQEYLITTRATAKAIDAITLTEDHGLRDDLSQTDYIIIAPPEFEQAVQPLLAYRQSQGLTTRLVLTTDIYNDFGVGIMDPAAIRAFLEYAYLNWQSPKLAYVLLVGDGTYDPLDYTGYGETVWLPPRLVEKDLYIGEVPSDHAYVNGLAVGDPDATISDAHIGRLPARSVEEAEQMVAKILRYENGASPLNDWRRRILFVTDDPDSAGDFYWLSDHLTDDIPNGLDLIPDNVWLQKAYLRFPNSPYDSELDVRDQIVREMDDGLLLMQYIGHAGPTQWTGSGGVWSSARGGVRGDINLLAESEALPMSLPWSCWEGYFVHPGQEVMSEAMIRSPNSGAIATFAPTGLDVASGHDVMAIGFFNALFGDNPTAEVGALTYRAKNLLLDYPAYERMWYTYMTYGDPALRLKVPECLTNENISCAEDVHLFLPSVLR